MNENTVLALGLGLTPPWRLVNSAWKPANNPMNSTWRSPLTAAACSLSGLRQALQGARLRRIHLAPSNFFQHHCYITAKLATHGLREHGVLRITAPWAREGSRFTLLFEHAA